MKTVYAVRCDDLPQRAAYVMNWVPVVVVKHFSELVIFFTTTLAHGASFGAKFPVFHWCNAKRRLEHVLDPFGVRALALPLAPLTLFSLSFLSVSNISVLPQWPGVFLWEKKVLRTFKAGWTPLKSIKWMESLCWKCLKKKTQKKNANQTTSFVICEFCM